MTLKEIARISDRQGGVYTTELERSSAGVELGFGYRHEERVRQQVVLTCSGSRR